MNTSRRYQYGSLTRRKRIRTEDVWQFRYYETTPEGQRRRRSKIIGMLSQYPTPTDIRADDDEVGICVLLLTLNLVQSWFSNSIWQQKIARSTAGLDTS
jgi:hypothetical protein